MVGFYYGGALALALGYCLGSIPFGLVLTKLFGAGDLRSIGSGNIGATNVLRTGRKGLAAATLVLDALKATLAVVVAWWAFGPPTALAAAAGAVLGHMYPVWLRFRGGKGVATYLGGLIGLVGIWPAAIVFALVWLAVAALTRYSSAAALAATLASPIAMAAIGEGGAALVFAALSALIWFKHSANIVRLLQGSSRRSGRKTRADGEQAGVAPYRPAALRLAAARPVRERRPAHISARSSPIAAGRGRRSRRCRISRGAAARRVRSASPRPKRSNGSSSPRASSACASSRSASRTIRRRCGRSIPRRRFSPSAAARRRCSEAAVAIVGSRNASAAGLTFAERLARGLGQAGYVIVSGLARGIDQRAHVASLETGAVGVLAGGHAKPYPSDAVPLMERMVETGAVVSEMPIEWEPRGRDFPRRNRIVSGLALGTVVVEAARGSGSLITARFALEQNRQVFAVPGSPLDPRAEGTNDLLKQGASICTGADDVLTALEPVRSSDLAAMLETGGEPGEPLWGEQSLFGVDPESTPRTRPGDEFDDASGAAYRTGDEAEAARERIIALLGPSPITLDELGRAAEASARDVRVALLELELAGRVEYSGDRVALRAIADESVSPTALQSNELLSSGWRIPGAALEVGFLVGFALGFGDGVGANIHFAFGFRHPEEIGEQVETRRDRHRFKLGGHVGDVARDVERFPRHSPARRIVGSFQRPRGAPFRLCQVLRVSVSGNLLRRPSDKPVHSEERGRRLPQSPSLGERPLFDARVTTIRTCPSFAVYKTPISELKNKSFPTKSGEPASTIMLR